MLTSPQLRYFKSSSSQSAKFSRNIVSITQNSELKSNMKIIRIKASISMWLLLFFAKNCNSCGNDFFKLEKSYSDKGFQLDCLKECKLTNSDLCQLKNCDIRNYQKVSEIQPSNCLSRDLLSFVKTNTNISTDNVKILEFNLYRRKENEKVVDLSPKLLQYFSKLGKLYIKSANLTVSAR